MSIAVIHWSGQHKGKVKSFVDSVIASKDLYKLDSYWLLLYELFRDGVIPNPYDDDVFQILKDNGVYFVADTEKIKADDLADIFPPIEEAEPT